MLINVLYLYSDNNKQKIEIMAYIKISDRNLKTVNVTFLSKDFKITKSVREDRVENFRQDVLAKYNLLFTNYPHLIKVTE